MPISTSKEDGFITVLSVQNEEQKTMEEVPVNNFVTVLSVGTQENEKEKILTEGIKIYRLPGERLGMGLKFVGGVSVTECIDQLFIQSITPDSPADRTKGSFGKLEEGDEILEIEGKAVCEMTRLECVSVLRDATVCISVLVSRAESMESANCRLKVRPPPIPPRKMSKLSVGVKNKDNLSDKWREERKKLKPPPPVPSKSANILQDEVPGEEVTSDSETPSLETDDCAKCPPTPTVYTDLLSEEDGRVFDSESDDTGSSVSTVISRAPSSCASFNGSMVFEANGFPSDINFMPMNMIQNMADFQDPDDFDLSKSSSFDLNTVLSPFEELERELALSDNELMLQQPKINFYLESGSEEDIKDEVNSCDGSEDVFQCLDEALDVAEEEETIEPPLSFQDEDDNCREEIVCKIDGESGEFMCRREKVCQKSKSENQMKSQIDDGTSIVSPPPVPPRRKSLNKDSNRHKIMQNPINKENQEESKNTTCDSIKLASSELLGCNISIFERKEAEDLNTSEPKDTEKEAIFDKELVKSDVITERDPETGDSIPSVSVEDIGRSDEEFVSSLSKIENENKDESVYPNDINDDDQILLILRDNVQEDSETDSTRANIQAQMIPVEDTVTESCKEDPQPQELDLESSGKLNLQQANTCGRRIEDRLEKDADSLSLVNETRPVNVSTEQLQNVPKLSSQLPHPETDPQPTTDSFPINSQYDEHKVNDDIMEPITSSKFAYHKRSEELQRYRQPPDGHEFPPRYQDGISMVSRTDCDVPSNLKMQMKYAYITEFTSSENEPKRQIKKPPVVPKKPKVAPPPLPKEPPPQLTPPKDSTPAIVGCVTKKTTPGSPVKTRKDKDSGKVELSKKLAGYLESSNKDRMKWKSEENLRKHNENKPISVKERIQMFSSQCKNVEKSSSKPEQNITKNYVIKTEVFDATDESKKYGNKLDLAATLKLTSSKSLRDKALSVENLAPVKARATYLSKESEIIQPNLVEDSDNAKISMKRRESFNGYASNYPQSQLASYRYSGTLSRGISVPNSSLELSRVSSPIISNLLESRRSTASKLRGLVIPENGKNDLKKEQKVPTLSKPGYRDSSSINYNLPNLDHQDVEDSNQKTVQEPMWNSGILTEVPKYSPAFKRRSLQPLTNSLSRIPAPKIELEKAKPINENLSDSKKSPNKASWDRYSGNRYSSNTNRINATSQEKKGLLDDCKDNDSHDEVTALNRLNNLIVKQNESSSPSEGVKKAVNGFIQGVFEEKEMDDRYKIETSLASSIFSSTKMPLEQGNDSCFEEDEENLTSKSSSPAPSIQSDDTHSEESSLGSMDNRNRMTQRYACRTNSSDSALKSLSSDQKSNYSATDDSWSDTSSDSIDRPIDPDLKPKRLSQQKTVLKEKSNETDSVKQFKALAQTWQERENSNSLKRTKSNDHALDKKPVVYRYTALNSYPSIDNQSDEQSHSNKLHNSLSPKSWLTPSKSLDELSDINERNYQKSVSNDLNFYNNDSGATLSTNIDRMLIDTPKSNLTTTPIHKRLSSIGSSISEGDYDYNYHSPLSPQSDVYGSVSSLASSGSFVSSQEMQQLLEEASHSLEESGTSDHQIFVVILHKEAFKSSTGIVLSGGVDYEQKEIVVHKIINGSLADRDGNMKKGDRILSINGRTLRNVTHRESLTMLRSPRSELTIVASRPRNYAAGDMPNIVTNLEKTNLVDDSSVSQITIIKEGAGLGFSLDGGKDSPNGDKPLKVKRIFTGGAAEKCGMLKVGNEILSVNGKDMTNMSRIEAWQFMKKLTDGAIKISIKQA